MKDPVVRSAPKRIRHIQFGVMPPQAIAQTAELEVTQRDLYTVPDRRPVRHGVLDARLGTSDKAATCDTCHKKMADCVGHFGYVKLCLPAFHIGFFKQMVTILQCICKSCARVLLTEENRRKYLVRLRGAANVDNTRRRSVAKNVNDDCKKVVYCPHCSSTNGFVKKVGALKIVHEKFRAKRTVDELAAFREEFDSAISFQPELKQHISRAQEDLNPLRVMQLFQQINTDDCELLGLDPENSRPEQFLWTAVPVPPVAIRPSVAQDGASTEDDLTVKLTEIIFTNALIRAGLDKGASVQNVMEQWEFLQLSIAMYINSEMPGVPSTMAQKPIRGFCQRLKGKQGRFRGNLSGKRVDFSGRTVISPDPNLRIDQVAVPERVAKILTFPERVNRHNLAKLQKLVRNGTDIHPGANFVQIGSNANASKRFLKYANRELLASQLREGDIVERHLEDGDIVLFNRQPSLHKLSIMSHFVKVLPWRTFRFNECVCTPYNADFDGDEMNMHVPQTEEARAEAIQLMGVKHNLVTPRNGEPIIAATQDFITGAYLITRKDVFYTRSEFAQICATMFDASVHIDMPPPAIIKPYPMWTGKQVFGILMRPNKESTVLVNLETKNRMFSKKDGRAFDLCPQDGYVVIRNSVIMCGAIDKAIVGDGNKSSLFYTVMRDHGSVAAAACMNRLAKLCARWLCNRGFSIGIDDVQPGEILQERKDSLVKTAYEHCDKLINDSRNGRLENATGCNQEQTLEALISGTLSKVRDDVGQICMTELDRLNAPLIMSQCGSKGSKINVSQMVACVGQQIISGSRIPDGFVDRSLPHFPKSSKTPAAKGFVRNSFYSGLLPTEFLFHAVSGREGLVDTAVKTAETGYMQRRLMKAMEDLTAQYDLSVRNSIGGIVQFQYGDDGLDPADLEGDSQPVEFTRAFLQAINAVPHAGGNCLLPYEITDLVEAGVHSADFVRNCAEPFLDSLRDFVKDKVVRMLADRRESAGLPRYEYVQDRPSRGKPKSGFNVVYVPRITEEQVRFFLTKCLAKYMSARVEPGTAVGAVGAQSIGEPGTQMTLKTFHFAGVASMNVTLGVPRIKEIINAAKAISTPIITCKLECDTSVTAARIVKGRIETTFLGDITRTLIEHIDADECYIEVVLDLEVMQKLQLETNIFEVASAIRRAKKLKLSGECITVCKPNRIRVRPPVKEKNVLYGIQVLKRSLPKVSVKGVPSAQRAVISDAGSGTYNLLVEGYGLRDVMTTQGIVGTQTTSNHIMDVQQVLGIEAARNTIINEISYTMSTHGMTIDPRHVMLLADTMTYKGEVLGITRFGVAKMKDSVLMLASFEKTTDHLFDAALFGKKDGIDGVSECIIMGIPMPIGTGLFKLISKAKEDLPPPRPLLFDIPEYHPSIFA